MVQDNTMQYGTVQYSIVQYSLSVCLSVCLAFSPMNILAWCLTGMSNRFIFLSLFILCSSDALILIYLTEI